MSPRDEHVRRQHHVEPGYPLGQRCVVGPKPIRAVVDEHAQRRGEAFQLALPVAEHRRRAHHQRRTPDRVGQHGRDELRGLAQTHVVGQAGAQTEPSQERQPADPPLLVGPEPAHKRVRGRHRGDRGVHGVIEQRAEPAVGGHAHDRRSARPDQRVEPEPSAHELARGGLARRARVGEQGSNLVGTNLDPHPSQPHE